MSSLTAQLSPRTTALVAVLALIAIPCFAQDVLTYHNNNARTGINNKETILTTSNVNAATFGKLFTVPADGLVDAEPLYLSAVSVGGVTHNLLIVATEHGSVYAYDADSGASLWHITTVKSGETTSDNARLQPGHAGDRHHRYACHPATQDRQSGDFRCRDVEGQIGKLSSATACARCDYRRRGSRRPR